MEIKSILNISNVKIYFGVIIGNLGKNWKFNHYYGESLPDNAIIKNDYMYKKKKAIADFKL